MTRGYALVDACVAAAVGDPTCEELACARHIVDSLVGSAANVLMTDHLLLEWKSHASRYMRSWLIQMTSRCRVKNVPDVRLRDYRRALKGVDPTMGKAALLKDVHLIEAAIYYGAGVVSLDDKQLTYLRNIMELYPRLKSVQWFNPVVDFDSCSHWVRTDCGDAGICQVSSVEEES